MFDNLNLMQNSTLETLILTVVAIWSVVWKGLALWKAAKKDHKYWYVAILLINTVGILEIIYLAFFQKKEKKK